MYRDDLKAAHERINQLEGEIKILHNNKSIKNSLSVWKFFIKRRGDRFNFYCFFIIIIVFISLLLGIFENRLGNVLRESSCKVACWNKDGEKYKNSEYKFVGLADAVIIKDNILGCECKFAGIHNQYIITESR